MESSLSGSWTMPLKFFDVSVKSMGVTNFGNHGQPALLPAMQQTRTLGFRNGLHTGVPQLRRLTPLLPYLD